MSARSVIESLNNLEIGHFIERIQRGNQYQRSVYRLNAHAHSQAHANAQTQLQAPATDGSAESAQALSMCIPEQVYVHSTTCVCEVCVGTRNHEEPIEEPIPTLRWVQILSSDPRWQEPQNGYTADVESVYASKLDLTMEAHRCLEWLQNSPKGKKRKSLQRTWANWLANALRDADGRPPKSRDAPATNGTDPPGTITDPEISAGDRIPVHYPGEPWFANKWVRQQAWQRGEI